MLGLESQLSRLDAGSFRFPGGKGLSNLGTAAGEEPSFAAGVYREENFNSPELRRLETLVQIEADEPLTAAGTRGATLVVEATGQRLEQKIGAIKGDPEQPMTEEEVREKFLGYAASCVEAGSAQRFAEAVLQEPAGLGRRDLWALLEYRGRNRP